MVKSIIFETRERHSQRVNAPFLDMGTNPKIFVHNQRHNAFHTPPKGSGRNHVSNKQISRLYKRRRLNLLSCLYIKDKNVSISH
jgi:hypothetical protein